MRIRVRLRGFNRYTPDGLRTYYPNCFYQGEVVFVRKGRFTAVTIAAIRMASKTVLPTEYLHECTVIEKLSLLELMNAVYISLCYRVANSARYSLPGSASRGLLPQELCEIIVDYCLLDGGYLRSAPPAALREGTYNSILAAMPKSMLADLVLKAVR